MNCNSLKERGIKSHVTNIDTNIIHRKFLIRQDFENLSPKPLVSLSSFTKFYVLVIIFVFLKVCSRPERHLCETSTTFTPLQLPEQARDVAVYANRIKYIYISAFVSILITNQWSIFTKNILKIILVITVWYWIKNRINVVSWFTQ